ncbi:MAG: DUF1330 domain-containing protein [Myxococcota bacterium]
MNGSVGGAAVERLVGLQVNDAAGYQSYRDGMMPILSRYGGRFVLDLDVARVRLAPDGASFNRLFVLRFPSAEVLDAFFSDPDYQRVRSEFFEPSVGNVSILRGWNEG